MTWPPAVEPRWSVLDLRRECFPFLATDDASFVECESGEPVGYIGIVLIHLDLHAARSRPAQEVRIGGLSGLCVHPKHREQGIGSRLVVAAEEWSRSQLCDFTALFTGTPGFYERLGYQQRKIESPSSATFLVKKLREHRWPHKPVAVSEPW